MPMRVCKPIEGHRHDIDYTSSGVPSIVGQVPGTFPSARHLARQEPRHCTLTDLIINTCAAEAPTPPHWIAAI